MAISRSTGLNPLMLGEGSPDNRSGGLPRYFAALFDALNQAGANPTAIVAGPCQVPHPNLVLGGDTRQPVLRRIWEFNKAASAARGGATVVDAHFALYAFLPVVAGKLRHLPLVVHFQGPWAEESRINRADPNLVVRAKWLVEAAVYRKADQLIVLSTAFKRVLVENYGVSPWRVNVVAPGVDLDHFSTGSCAVARERLNLSNDAHVAVVVRRLVRRMGLDVLLEGWQEIQRLSPRSVLLIVGTGPQEEELKQRAASLEITDTIRFLGRIDDDTLVAAYRAADVAIVPTLSLEGFGLVVIEAMACGTPVIATRVGGMPEMLSPFDADLLVPPGDAQALAKRVGEALRGDVPARTLCRAFAEKFSWTLAAQQNLKVYEAAVNSPLPKPRVVFIDHCAALSGGELALLRVLPALTEVEVHVILAEEGPLMERLIEAGVSVELLKMPEASRNLHRDRVTVRRLPLSTVAQTAVYVIRLTRRLRRLHPQVVHTNSLKSALYGGVSARIARIPAVIHVRDRIADDYLPKAAVRPVRFAIRHLATSIIANSEATKATLGQGPFERVVAISDANKQGGTQLDRITTIPSPIEAISPHPITRSGDSEKFRIGMVGRLAPWKGQHIFLAAFAQAFPTNRASASIVGAALFGEDAYEAELIEQIERLGIKERVEMKGFREHVSAELSKMDVLVHASVIPEPFGLVVVEGMAVGLPVVAPAAGGPLEIIEDGLNGLLYPPGDVETLAAILRRLADDPDLRRRLGQAAKKTAAGYSPDAIATRVTGVYREILGAGWFPESAAT